MPVPIQATGQLAQTGAVATTLAAESTSDGTSYPQDSGCATIFVVDDQKLIAVTLGQILLERGLNAVWFTEPANALTAACSYIPSLLITDYDMPEMTGVELARSVRRHCPECHVIIISAHSLLGESSFINVVPAWMHVFEKPVRLEELFSRIHLILSASTPETSSSRETPQS